MSVLLGISRFIVGVLFIFSGLIKANDPLGLSYKMQEFFEVWGMHQLNDLTLSFSIVMITFEIVAGVAVLIGWQMRLFSWLLLLLTIFFTFLTGYALFSGKVRECGCFGDCIPLSAQQSFIKDLVLLALIVFIFAKRGSIKSRLPASLAAALLGVSLLGTLGLQWYVLHYLPVFDCLPYRVNKNIEAQMQPPPGAIRDSTVITYVYEKGGKEIEFTADSFPDDFDEEVYQFKNRYDKLVRKGNAEPPIRDFALKTADGADSTAALLSRKGYQVLMFTRGFDQAEPDWTPVYKKMYEAAKARQIPVIAITSDFDNITAWAKRSGPVDEIYKCDFVAIKTAARTNPTFYLISNGTIVNKWSAAHLDHVVQSLENLPPRTP